MLKKAYTASSEVKGWGRGESDRGTEEGGGRKGQDKNVDGKKKYGQGWVKGLKNY